MSKPPGFSRLLPLLGAISLLTSFSRDMYSPTLLTLPAFFAGLRALGIGCLGIAYVVLRESIPVQRCMK
jgi:hypothetical protein